MLLFFVGCWRDAPPRLALQESELLKLMPPTVSAFYAWKNDSAAFQEAFKSLRERAVPALPALLGDEVLRRRGFPALAAALQQAQILSLSEPVTVREGLIFCEAGPAPRAAVYLVVNASVSLSQFISLLTTESANLGAALTRESFAGGSGYRLAPAPHPLSGGAPATEVEPLYISAEGERLAIATDLALLERFFAGPDAAASQPSLFEDAQFNALSEPLRTSDRLLSLGFVTLRPFLEIVPIDGDGAEARRKELLSDLPVRAVAFGSRFADSLSVSARALVESEGEVQQRWIQAVASGPQLGLPGELPRDTAMALNLAGGAFAGARSLIVAEQPIEKQRSLEPLMAALDGISRVILELRSEDGPPAASVAAHCGERCAPLEAQVRKVISQGLAFGGVEPGPWRSIALGSIAGVTLQSAIGLSPVLVVREQQLLLATSPATAAAALARLDASGKATVGDAGKVLDSPTGVLAGRIVPAALFPLLSALQLMPESQEVGSSNNDSSHAFRARMEALGPVTFSLSVHGNVWELASVYDGGSPRE